MGAYSSLPGPMPKIIRLTTTMDGTHHVSGRVMAESWTAESFLENDGADG
jgi:hypothetical protein